MRFYIASIFLTIFVVHTKQGKVNIAPKKELEIWRNEKWLLVLLTLVIYLGENPIDEILVDLFFFLLDFAQTKEFSFLKKILSSFV